MNARLDRELQVLLDNHCKRTGISRSEVVREALNAHLAAKGRSQPSDPYSLAEDPIPLEGLPERQSSDVKQIMNKHWRGKRTA